MRKPSAIRAEPLLTLAIARSLSALKCRLLNPANETISPKRPLRVAWFTYFPVEWLTELPPELQNLPKLHPATWQRVLWEEFRKDETLELHIIILRSHFPKTLRFRLGNTTFHCIKTISGTRAPTLFWADTLYVARALKQIQPDLVHAWGSEFGAAAIAGRLKWPALVTMQGILTWIGTAVSLNSHAKLARIAEARSLCKAHVVSCESSFSMQYLAERYPHLKLLQIEHAPNPIFSSVQRVPRSHPIRVVSIAPFQTAKGADIAIDSLAEFAQSHDVELVWIGSSNPALEAELRGRTPESIWRRITFKNGLVPEQIAEELSTATFLLHPTRADSSPNAVKEAVVAGVPVIATKTGGIPDYVFPARNGFLFANGSVADCASKLRDAAAHPFFGLGQVEPQALTEMRAYLSAETMAQKFRDAYGKVMALDPRFSSRALHSRETA